MWEWIKKIIGKTDVKLPAAKPIVADSSKKELIRRIINAFEMGKTTVDYDAIYIYADGPGNRRQLTLSWGLTEYGNLKRFLQEYIKAKGKFSDSFKKYIDSIGRTPLVDNSDFKVLLKRAAREDQVYKDLMDRMYYELYYNPAMKWADNYGFKLPLSRAVIQDSMIHSGSILSSLRSRFPEPLPSAGGNEKEWIRQYCEVRAAWLQNHSRTILNKTSVRPKMFLREIARDNWYLEKTPINCNGVSVS